MSLLTDAILKQLAFGLPIMVIPESALREDDDDEEDEFVKAMRRRFGRDSFFPRGSSAVVPSPVPG